MEKTVDSTDSWEVRIENAAKVMELDPAKVNEILDSPGFEITRSPVRLEMISDESVTPFGDLRKLFCEDLAKVPVPKLRMAIKYLRGPVESKKTDTVDPDILALQRKFGIRTKMEDLGIEDLLPFYNPLKVNNVHTILRNRYEAKYGPIIAFKPDSQEVAIEETVNYITDLETGYSSEQYVEVDGEPVKLCKVGEVPNQLVDEDPLYVGSPLKRERSTNNHLNWSGIPHDVRVFFRILVQRNEINVGNRIEVAQMIKKPLAELKGIFPEAYIEFSEKKNRDELPKLHMSMSDVTKSKVQNPFGGRNRTF